MSKSKQEEGDEQSLLSSIDEKEAHLREMIERLKSEAEQIVKNAEHEAARRIG